MLQVKDNIPYIVPKKWLCMALSNKDENSSVPNEICNVTDEPITELIKNSMMIA